VVRGSGVGRNNGTWQRSGYSAGAARVRRPTGNKVKRKAEERQVQELVSSPRLGSGTCVRQV